MALSDVAGRWLVRGASIGRPRHPPWADSRAAEVSVAAHVGVAVGSTSESGEDNRLPRPAGPLLAMPSSDSLGAP
jgi:hypothetical protein